MRKVSQVKKQAIQNEMFRVLETHILPFLLGLKKVISPSKTDRWMSPAFEVGLGLGQYNFTIC